MRCPHVNSRGECKRKGGAAQVFRCVGIEDSRQSVAPTVAPTVAEQARFDRPTGSERWTKAPQRAVFSGPALFVRLAASTSLRMKRWIPFLKSGPRVSIVRMQGAIGMAGRSSISDRSLATILEKAFKAKPDAVALEINSPGGSPVQSSLIGARIRRLAEEKEVPVYAFVEDVAASGGYWIASAADEIWTDPSSVLGSIGVISAGFGLPVFLQRQGIERRVHTAGKSKSMLDPFRPEREEDVERLNKLLEQLHGTFIGHVKTRRGDKLSGNADLFTGEIWVGQAAVDEGLADGVGHLVPKMKEIFGDKVRFKRFEARKPLLPRLGASAVQGALAEIEERAEFARFGLS